MAIDGTKVRIGNWIVRIVRQGDKYGATMSLTHNKPVPLIEFYDVRFPDLHVMGGQFVTRYDVDTLFPEGHWSGGALSLHMGEPNWTVDAATMRDIAWFINEFLED